MFQAAPSSLIAQPAPPPATDLIESALFLPLAALSMSHHGRKVRTIGQILAFDVKSGRLLVSSGTDKRPDAKQIATLLVDVSIALLGQSPAVTDLSYVQDSIWSRHGLSTANKRTSDSNTPTQPINRQRVRLDHGEWVCIVGWLEGCAPRMTERGTVEAIVYAPPLPVVLEAIHISQARQPPDDVIFRGSIR